MKIIKILISIVTSIFSLISTGCLLFLPLFAVAFISEDNLTQFLNENQPKLLEGDLLKEYYMFILFCLLVPFLLNVFSNIKKARLASKIALAISALIIALGAPLVIVVFLKINLFEAKVSMTALTYLLFICMQSFSIYRSLIMLFEEKQTPFVS